MSDTAHIDGKWRDRAHSALKVVGAVLLAALVLQISWNMFAPEIFGLPEMRSKHALGLMAALTATAMLLRFSAAGARP